MIQERRDGNTYGSGERFGEVIDKVFGFIESKIGHVVLDVVESGTLKQILINEQKKLQHARRWPPRAIARWQEARRGVERQVQQR